MKVVVNRCYGGFSLSRAAMEALGVESPYEEISRINPNLIAFVEKDALSGSGRHAKLQIVEIPDEATDWEISEYDGFETIIYVLNGKLYHA